MKENKPRVRIAFLAGVLVIAAGCAWIVARHPHWLRYMIEPAKILTRRSVDDALKQYSPAAESRLVPRFAAAGVIYPPQRFALIGYKKEKLLELRVTQGENRVTVHRYPVLAASGGPGPKLKEGDRQVPEGIYRISYLNPDSLYHLSMKVSYPNAFDQAKAAQEGRTGLGGDIFIHGKAVSIGCLAIGDEAIEELFVLAAKTGYERVKVLLLPQADLAAADLTGLPDWTPELYRNLQSELAQLGPPAPHETGNP